MVGIKIGKSVTIFKFPRGRPFKSTAWRLTLNSAFLYTDCTNFRQSLAHTNSGWIHDLNSNQAKRTPQEFIIQKLNPLLVVDFRLLSALSREFTREAVVKFLPAPFSWNWCKYLLRSLIHSKISNLTKYREVLVKYSLLITHAEMPLWIWHQLRERLADSFFK